MSKVFLTGASGFIAKHILRELLDHDHDVRASIRSEKRKAEIEALFRGANIEFAYLDLTRDEGWEEAMSGCDVLIHTASPFPMSEPKNRDDLIRPAVDGTLRALKAAKAAGIGRVILTSSNVAIYKDSSKPKSDPSDESNWTDADDASVGAYDASKTLAERAAWDFVADNPDMALTTINPGVVFGPPMDPYYGTSLQLVERLMSGKDPLAPPMKNMPVVDVRDVAMLHVAAMDLDDAKGERFSATAGNLSYLDLANILREWDPSLKLPTREAPGWLLRFMGLFMADAKLIAKNIGRNLAVSGAKAERVFDFKFIPARDALIGAAEAVRSHKG